MPKLTMKDNHPFVHVGLQVRTKAENLVVAGIIGGPKKPKTLQPALKLLVDQLNQLKAGVSVWDPQKQKDVICRVKLAFSQHDYPGMKEVCLQHAAGS